MTRIWAIADTHFGHANILTFKNDKEELIRGKVFKTIEEHDETLIDNWNKTVKPSDHIYHLGDVVIHKRFLKQVIPRLNGKKRLVRGNHDVFKTKDYLDVGFEEIYGVRVWPKHNIIMSHIPLHRDSLVSRGWLNVHGHLHEGYVRDSNGRADPLYMCVSAEHVKYTPTLVME